ncbi:uncharacterized protein LOC135930230 [Gordionus sp. m RMFG-2023]|uniref:uncharacterized protein LOC135930230 n=1 Tax=Gordionus sp. m RMFG-2023 TaxID=3053472 RepID=UPI0031FD00C2
MEGITLKNEMEFRVDGDVEIKRDLVEDKSEKDKCPHVEIVVGSRKILMLLDTGAAISIVGYENFCKYWPEENIIKEKMRVKQFDGSEIKVLGKIEVPDDMIEVQNDEIKNRELCHVKSEILGNGVMGDRKSEFEKTNMPQTRIVPVKKRKVRYTELSQSVNIVENDDSREVKKEIPSRKCINERNNGEKKIVTKTEEIEEKIISQEMYKELDNGKKDIPVLQNFLAKFVRKKEKKKINGGEGKEQLSNLENWKLAVAVLMNSHSEIFEEKLGCLVDYEVDIRLKEGFVPQYCPVRRVPFEWRAEMEKELDNWVRDGIICPIGYSEWATPLVPVRKAYGKLRLCADFRVTLNPWVV